MNNNLHRELVSLSVFAFFAWALTTFGLVFVFWIKGGLTPPDGPAISRQVHLTLLELTNWLIYRAIPGLTSGYLLFALLVLRQAQKIKRENRSMM